MTKCKECKNDTYLITSITDTKKILIFLKEEENDCNETFIYHLGIKLGLEKAKNWLNLNNIKYDDYDFLCIHEKSVHPDNISNILTRD